MPRKPQTATAEAPDPLADLREPDDAARYPEDGQGGPQDGPEAPGEADPLAALLLERLEAAMAIPLDADGILTGDHHAMAQALAAETAADLGPHMVQVTDADDAVERWHDDTVAVGFLHKGGRCGCAYLARVILGA